MTRERVYTVGIFLSIWLPLAILNTVINLRLGSVIAVIVVSLLFGWLEGVLFVRLNRYFRRRRSRIILSRDNHEVIE